MVNDKYITNVPVDLLVWVAKTDIIKASVLKTYLYLKLKSISRISQLNPLYNEISKELGVNLKTAKKHIDLLIAVNFINVDKKRRIYFVRSKNKIIPHPHRKCNYFAKIDINQLEHFTEYIIAAVAAYMVKKKMAKHRLALNNDSATQRSCLLHQKFRIGLPLSLSYIAHFFNKSISWVHKFKKKAKALGLIKVCQNLIETNTPWSDRMHYLKTENLTIGRIKRFRDKVYVIASDLISPKVHVVKRKKSA